MYAAVSYSLHFDQLWLSEHSICESLAGTGLEAFFMKTSCHGIRVYFVRCYWRKSINGPTQL